MTQPALPKNIEELVVLDGQNVIMIERAKVPVPGQDGTLGVSTTVSDKVFAVLLADERTVYIDNHHGVDCDKFFTTAHSVSAHFKVHAPRAQAKAAEAALAETQARLAEFEQKAAIQRANRSEGAKRAAAAKAAGTKVPKPTSAAKQFNAVKLLINSLAMDIAAARGGLDKIARELDQLSTDVDKLGFGPDEIDVDNLTVEQRFALVKKLMS